MLSTTVQVPYLQNGGTSYLIIFICFNYEGSYAQKKSSFQVLGITEGLKKAKKAGYHGTDLLPQNLGGGGWTITLRSA